MDTPSLSSSSIGDFLDLLYYAEARHEFNASKTFSGFKRFIPLGELYDPERGYVVNDTCIVEADVAVPRVLDWTDGSKTEARLCTTIQVTTKWFSTSLSLFLSLGSLLNQISLDDLDCLR